MTTQSLLSLGSNLGDRDATLRDALRAIRETPTVDLLRQSSFHVTTPIGGPSGQGDFLNAAAVVETDLSPAALLQELQRIETEFGRRRDERWGARTLDLDLLLHGGLQVESESLTIPHPRMSFRRFVLEPSVEIAADWIHPKIGWSIGHLSRHLDHASNCLAVVSPSPSERQFVANLLAKNIGARVVPSPSREPRDFLWPLSGSTWIEVSTAVSPNPAAPPSPPYAEADYPKFTILIGSSPASASDAPSQRGPTLELRTTNPAEIESEILAAVRSVWPYLGTAA